MGKLTGVMSSDPDGSTIQKKMSEDQQIRERAEHEEEDKTGGKHTIDEFDDPEYNGSKGPSLEDWNGNPHLKSQEDGVVQDSEMPSDPESSSVAKEMKGSKHDDDLPPEEMDDASEEDYEDDFD